MPKKEEGFPPKETGIAGWTGSPTPHYLLSLVLWLMITTDDDLIHNAHCSLLEMLIVS